MMAGSSRSPPALDIERGNSIPSLADNQSSVPFLGVSHSERYYKRMLGVEMDQSATYGIGGAEDDHESSEARVPDVIGLDASDAEQAPTAAQKESGGPMPAALSQGRSDVPNAPGPNKGEAPSGVGRLSSKAATAEAASAEAARAEVEGRAPGGQREAGDEDDAFFDALDFAEEEDVVGGVSNAPVSSGRSGLLSGAGKAEPRTTGTAPLGGCASPESDDYGALGKATPLQVLYEDVRLQISHELTTCLR